MKRFIYLAAALVITAGLCARGEKNDWAQFDRYASSNAEIIADTDNSRRVIFFGNSITDNWPRMRPGFFSGNGFIGRGISGQSTYQFLSRFRADVIDLRPQAVVINAATNDIAENTHPYDENRTFGNIRSMVELAQANGIKVILTSTLPAGFFGWNRSVTDGPEKIARLNRRIASYAEANSIPFVDYYASMLDADGKSMDSRYTDDGVHPTEAGYAVMEALILPAIRSIVR